MRITQPALLVALLAAVPLLGAAAPDGPAPAASTVIKSDGEVLRGEIAGLVVLKSEEKRSEEDGEVSFTVTYYTVNGVDVVAIDQDGLHPRPGAVVGVWIVVQETPPDDVEALETASGPQGFLRRLPKGGGLLASGQRGKEGPIAGRLLGEFRLEGDRGRFGDLRISTATGSLTLPVESIVETRKPEP